MLAPGFLTFVIVLATLWAPSVQKWSFYKNGKNWEERCEKWQPGKKQAHFLVFCHGRPGFIHLF